MERKETILHSHSGLERLLGFPKNVVLVDKEFAPLFAKWEHLIEPFRYKQVEYIKVPISLFVFRYGEFKNLMK